MPMKARQLMQTGITTQTKRKLIFSFSDGCTAIILNLATSLFRSLSQSTSWDLALSAICTSSHYVCRRSGSFTRQHHRHHQRSRSTSLTISKRKETTSQKSSKHSVLMFANPSTEHLPLYVAGVPHAGILPRVATPYQKEYRVNGTRRRLYPKNWEHLARQCKEQAGKRCEFCHVKQGRKRKSKRTGKKYPVYLHAAHADHDRGNPTPRLICLCPTCHGRYDHQHRKRQHRIALEQLKHRKILVPVSN